MGVPGTSRRGRRRRGRGLNVPSLGWFTDLEILRLGGSRLSVTNEHIVVQTPENPGYYWGNFLLMTSPRPPHDCLELFSATFPREQLALGTLWQPDPADWPGLTVESSTVLVSGEPPVAPAVPGYEFREFGEADWEQSLRSEIEDKDEAFKQFVRRRNRTRAQLVEAGVATWLGAFQQHRLVGELGIVRLGTIARYQSVLTAAEHRGRGVASHLLHLAGVWARARGCEQLVIISETGSDAERLYRKLGFHVHEHVFGVEGTLPVRPA